MIFAIVFGAFGLLLLVAAILVTTSQRKNRLQIRRLQNEVERMTDQLRTEEERDAEARRIEAVEAEKREIHGRFDNAGG